MKVVCGLGNPGEEYAATRHNVGWWVLDAARKAWGMPVFQRDEKRFPFAHAANPNRTTSGRAVCRELSGAFIG